MFQDAEEVTQISGNYFFEARKKTNTLKKLIHMIE